MTALVVASFAAASVIAPHAVAAENLLSATLTAPLDVPVVQGITHGFDASGSVTVAYNGTPLAGSSVSVVVQHDASGRFQQLTGITDADGVFSFTLAGPHLPGEYSVHATAYYARALATDSGSFRVHVLGVTP